MQTQMNEVSQIDAANVDTNEQSPNDATCVPKLRNDVTGLGRRWPRRQTGATTGEYLFWSLLAAGVLAVSVATYLRGNNQGNAQALIKDFSALAADAGQTFQGNWGAFTTANADSAGLFKGYTSWNDLGGGNIALNVGAGGTITVAGATLQTANDSGEYTLTGLNQVMCKDFVTAVQSASGSVTVNATVVKKFGGVFQPDQMNCNDTNNKIVVIRAS